LKGSRVQDVDRPPDVEAFAEPGGARRVRVQAQANRLVPRAERMDGIVGNLRWKRDVRHRSSVRSPESQFAVGLSLHLVSLFVDGTMMAPAQEREVRERRGSPLGPVADVMTLTERSAAAREPATSVAVLQRAT